MLDFGVMSFGGIGDGTRVALNDLMERQLHVRHIYTHDPSDLEKQITEAIRQVVEGGGVIGDIKYAIDPSSGPHVRGGFGALMIFESGEK